MKIVKHDHKNHTSKIEAEGTKEQCIKHLNRIEESYWENTIRLSETELIMSFGSKRAEYTYIIL